MSLERGPGAPICGCLPHFYHLPPVHHSPGLGPSAILTNETHAGCQVVVVGEGVEVHVSRLFCPVHLALEDLRYPASTWLVEAPCGEEHMPYTWTGATDPLPTVLPVPGTCCGSWAGGEAQYQAWEKPAATQWGPCFLLGYRQGNRGHHVAGDQI